MVRLRLSKIKPRLFILFIVILFSLVIAACADATNGDEPGNEGNGAGQNDQFLEQYVGTWTTPPNVEPQVTFTIKTVGESKPCETTSSITYYFSGEVQSVVLPGEKVIFAGERPARVTDEDHMAVTYWPHREAYDLSIRAGFDDWDSGGVEIWNFTITKNEFLAGVRIFEYYPDRSPSVVKIYDTYEEGHGGEVLIRE